MIKNNKWRLIVSSIIILLPTLLGWLGKSLLPGEIAVHWGPDGAADGWMPPSLAFTVLPIILLAFHWLCLLLTVWLDKSNENQNKKIQNLVFWIIPGISLLSCGIILSVAMGYTLHIYSVVLVVLALTFILIGNYMPKTTRNLTTGIKLKWTLSNEENWNATHRFAGKLWVIAGVLCLFAIPLPPVAFPFVAIGLILLCCLPPVVYSYRFYKKQLAAGEITREDYQSSYRKLVNTKVNKIFGIVTAVILSVIAIAVCILMFTGEIEATADDTMLTVKASFWEDLSVSYEDIDSIEYLPEGVDGERVYGFGSAKLLLGSFQNSELGVYTRYTYTKSRACILLKAKGHTVVIGAEQDEATKALYDKIYAARIIDAE